MAMMTTTKILAAGALLGALAGCGADDAGRRPVSGSVALDGRPLPDGSLTLVPIGTGPAVGATIADGAFSIPQPEGPIPGAYRVEILSIRATGRKIPDPEGPKGTIVEERKNVVPDRYGASSTLRVDVTAAGPNVFRFDADSKPDPPRQRKLR